jgi:hypothetical protein
MSRSIHAAQGESLPYNHHLHQFLTFLKHERVFADATIVNHERSLKPFLGWLVTEDVPLSSVSPVRGPSTGRPGARRVKTSVIYALCSDHAYPEGWTARLSWSVCRLRSLF